MIEKKDKELMGLRSGGFAPGGDDDSEESRRGRETVRSLLTRRDRIAVRGIGSSVPTFIGMHGDDDGEAIKAIAKKEYDETKSSEEEARVVAERVANMAGVSLDQIEEFKRIQELKRAKEEIAQSLKDAEVV